MAGTGKRVWRSAGLPPITTLTAGFGRCCWKPRFRARSRRQRLSPRSRAISRFPQAGLLRQQPVVFDPFQATRDPQPFLALAFPAFRHALGEDFPDRSGSVLGIDVENVRYGRFGSPFGTPPATV